MSEPTDDASPAVKAQRDVVAMAHSIVMLLGAQRIQVTMADAVEETAKAVRLLKYADDSYQAECKKLDGIIASEALGKPVNVENHSVISLAPEQKTAEVH